MRKNRGFFEVQNRMPNSYSPREITLVEYLKLNLELESKTQTKSLQKEKSKKKKK